MKLKDFIKQFVEPNTLIRLNTKLIDRAGYQGLENDKVYMSWELEKEDNKYSNRDVLGVTDILHLNDPYVEAVNIVIV
jgi:hypothetical protein